MSDPRPDPNPHLIEQCLRQVHARFAGEHRGEVASYIPELLTADPDHFGIALATADGAVYAVGDVDVPFTIQSVSKPFVYGMALQDHGLDAVMAKIGVEPSGEAFNSITMDERHNRPMNPMVNAGAIAAAALVRGEGYEERLGRVVDTFGAYAGRPLSIDEKVFASERATGNRNRAIAFLELSTGMIEGPVDEHLDLYFAQCSLLVTARDLVMMGATLANGGRNPCTGVQAIDAEGATRVLSVMATCGMYDWSGEWMYRVGLPAKSGVGGGILVVLPGQLAIATFSPRLDEYGNSTRGVLACETLARDLSLHLLHPVTTAESVVRRRYDAATVSSKRVRRAEDRDRLVAEGTRIRVFELQGDLTFASAERLLRDVEPALDGAREVILDFRRVGRADPTARSLLGHLAAAARDAGVRLQGAAVGAEIRAGLEACGWATDAFATDVDDALERAENALLEIAPVASTDHADVLPLGAIDILAGLSSSELAVIERAVSARRYGDGETIIRAGDEADRLFFLVAGRAVVVLPLGDGGRLRRLRTFSEGVAFGESALFSGARRTADVVADGPVECRELTLDRLHHLAAEHPHVHAAILAGVGRNLAGQLAKAMDEIRSLDA